ncbi:ankyrin repeat domain-containing protein 49 isoform X2 [Petromyzon marinus]|uniref:ankyrin repeat domain-containing protein 49 isoform X2 n=1 Tax=Petromyzon marinus TaxID=7757 RepID=UPI003F6F3489
MSGAEQQGERRHGVGEEEEEEPQRGEDQGETERDSENAVVDTIAEDYDDDDDDDDDDEEEGGGAADDVDDDDDDVIEEVSDDAGSRLLQAAAAGRLVELRSLLAMDPALVLAARDSDGYGALHRAASHGHRRCASALLHAGAEVGARTNDGWTPLHCACRWNHVTLASTLLQHGADVNARTNGLQTALHVAASERGSARTLELLLGTRGVETEWRNRAGDTARQLAERAGPNAFLFEVADACVNSTPET